MKLVKIGDQYVNPAHVACVNPRTQWPTKTDKRSVTGSIVVTTWERIETDLMPEQVVAVLENAGEEPWAEKTT